MNEFVLGFAISQKGHVVLIHKTKPEWQAGKWNGVGGKVELGESPQAAMAREFREETGCELILPWRKFAVLRFKSCLIYVYAVELPDDAVVKTTTEESVAKFVVDEVGGLNVIPNLKWLVPMAYASLFDPFGGHLHADVFHP